MPIAAQYNDGQIARVHECITDVVDGNLLIADPDSGETFEAWPAADVFPVHGRKNELRVGCTGKPYGARLTYSGPDDVQRARELLPALANKHRMERGKQYRIVGLATAALVSVIAA